MSKKDADLPSIIEERTQEEIILRGGKDRRDIQANTIFKGDISKQNTQVPVKSQNNTQMPNFEDVKTLIGEEKQKIK